MLSDPQLKHWRDSRGQCLAEDISPDLQHDPTALQYQLNSLLDRAGHLVGEVPDVRTIA